MHEVTPILQTSLVRPHETQDQRPLLQDLLGQHGAVNEVNLMMDRITGKSRGFAFITMNNGGEAHAAMGALNGRALKVNEARPREQHLRPYGGKRPFAGNRW